MSLVKGNQVAAADELVEFEQMHDSWRTRFGHMKGKVHVIRIPVDFGHVRRFQAVSKRQLMETERASEKLRGWLITLRDVEPYEAVEHPDLMALEGIGTHPEDFHRGGR
jgi:hypothetical protein